MVFNSFEFILFFLFIFFGYWALKNRLKAQNLLLLSASYFFYGWWDYRFLALIFGSSLIDYLVSLKIDSTTRKKGWLVVSLIMNLGCLFTFKYFNFFIESFVDLSNSIGLQTNVSSLNIILPVGISFYTFQTLSYTIDVYREKLKPSTNWIEFFTFVSFFPQLVAGPIERASHLLPQFSVKKTFNSNQSIQGLKQIVWGLFKKVVVADTCAGFVDFAFDNFQDHSGITLIIGVVCFAFQIYGDFSGYSDMAIGLGKLLGFNLMTNFKVPYFSRNVAEFWRRWHISLSTWFRDYVYFPLGGSKEGKAKSIRNVLIIFLVSGFWHGANWTYIIWGGLNGLFFIPLLIKDKNRNYLDTVAEGKTFAKISDIGKMVFTFSLICLAWIFFRASSLDQATSYISTIFENISILNFPTSSALSLFLIGILVFIEWIGRLSKITFDFKKTPKLFKQGFYILIILAVCFFFDYNTKAFIYFQF